MDWTLLGFQVLNGLLLLSWGVLVFLALRDLNRHRVARQEHLLWAIVVLLVPWIGATLCLFVINKHDPLEKA